MSHTGSAATAERLDGADEVVGIDDDGLVTAQGALGVVHETSEMVDQKLSTINESATSQVTEMVDVSEDVAELNATIEEVAASASQMASRSDHAAEAAIDGQNATADATAALEDVTELITAVADDVDQLVESVERIDEILDVISTIAEETNLLALNASIQAAKAGADGNGFAVVADEIKSLANESQKRTDEVETVVDEITSATTTVSERLEAATDAAETGTERTADAEQELETVSSSIEEVASGIEQVSTATTKGAAASERVANRCEETADAADRIDGALTEIETDRSRQTDMIAEVDRTLEAATESRRDQLAAEPSVPTAIDAIDDVSGGFPRGGRGVVDATAETTARVDDVLASTVTAAIAAGYDVSLSPTASLERRTLRDAFRERDTDHTLETALEADRLFVIDLFDAWTGESENVFGVENRSLGSVNECIDRQRERPLLVIGNIAGECHAFGEQATRKTTYDNDGGMLEATDTVVNVIDEDVPATLAQFYRGAADQLVRIDEASVVVAHAPSAD
ncbi:methyl-accepting chemotaxis protein [Natronolimnobius sp. AArcel1]|uniref:methyl-accepting chemotaxis protein n=1 Tax=Natronolimnobius sp. AArcel1 TaxID=1679093 RepID=UPI0013EBA329|nr:methyl-accepting chemotaxis protein [Natronolimnobius sp. AArcel1]NGM71139.1 methyl-accepting chemotaxis protein [Natronolimnobius sp. AArcel1]